MTENDREHKAFEALGRSMGLNMEMHPMHLLYLDPHTDKMLKIFKAGFMAGKIQVPEISQSLIENGAVESLGISRDTNHPLAHLLDHVVRFKKESPLYELEENVRVHDYIIGQVQFNHKGQPAIRGYAIDRYNGESRELTDYGRCIDPNDVEIVG